MPGEGQNIASSALPAAGKSGVVNYAFPVPSPPLSPFPNLSQAHMRAPSQIRTEQEARDVEPKSSEAE